MAWGWPARRFLREAPALGRGESARCSANWARLFFHKGRRGWMVRRARTSESRREPRVNEARCASFRRPGPCEQARDFRAQASKKATGCLRAHQRAHGPHGPTPRARGGRAASRAENGLPTRLRRPQRRRADRRRGDARDLRDLRVSPVAAAAAIPAARLRRGWRRDGPVRHPCASSGNSYDSSVAFATLPHALRAATCASKTNVPPPTIRRSADRKPKHWSRGERPRTPARCMTSLSPQPTRQILDEKLRSVSDPNSKTTASTCRPRRSTSSPSTRSM